MHNVSTHISANSVSRCILDVCVSTRVSVSWLFARLTGEIEAAVPVAFGRGVGWRGGAGGVALLEGRGGGGRRRGGGGRIAAGVQWVQYWRMILVGAGRQQTERIFEVTLN